MDECFYQIATMLSPYIANTTKMDFNLKTTHYTFNVNGPLSMS